MDLNSQWIAGFVDGEGSFFVGINKQTEMSTGFQVLPEFTVVQHERDIQVLYALKSYFGCGVVRKNHGDRMCYRVRSIDHLTGVIIPFFEKHKLKTKKRIDFELFRSILQMIQAKEHLTKDGIDKIKSITSKMNTKKAIIDQER
jgi:hypothetical protein